eukprot:20507-Eustigmatos_ZCMA.PRE.1
MREGDDGDKSEDEGVDEDTATPAPEVRPDLASGKTQHGKLVQDIIKEQKKVRSTVSLSRSHLQVHCKLVLTSGG